MIEFKVVGVPIPKGSTKAFLHRSTGRLIVTATNLKTKPWAEMISLCAQVHAPAEGLWTGAIQLMLRFGLPRPRSLPKRVIGHTKKPDLDKLVRTVKDALKGVIYRDDAQVVQLYAEKFYGDPPGVQVTLTDLG